MNTMKWLLILCMLNYSIGLFSQKTADEIFKRRIIIPDSIANILDKKYRKGDFVNASAHIVNLVNRNDTTFKDGIYAYWGQGPHFPRRVFIYHKKKLYVFQNLGFLAPKKVIKEFGQVIESLKLSDKETVLFLKAIAIYLEEEQLQTYGYN